MKKNISINISGIIFHIEEDGYDMLKSYLDAINKYFSSYEDSEEIVADIEGRIAEIFLGKLKDDKQVISKTDIEALIQTMGQVADFEAMETEEDHASSAKQEEPKAKKQKTKAKTKATNNGRRKWERDTQRQLIGGVSAGLAHYFNTDPIWIRGGFILLFLAGGISVLLYPILWIALPGNDSIPENDAVRKLYRDPDDRVIGGVSGGLAKYFRTDPLLFRVLFIIFAFGGFGILTYIVLWIITPKANSLTDKMQMEGEKVTIENINSTIKKKKKEELNPKGENTFTKVILFPFRLIGRIFSGLGRAIAPLMLFLVAAIRVFVGGIISLVGVSVMFSFLVTAGVLFGFYNGDWFMWDPELTYFPYEVFRNTIPGIGVLFLLAVIFIPFLYLFMAGLTIIAKRRVMTTSFGWSVLGIWVISIIGSFAILPNVVRDFREEGVYRETDQLSISADTLVIDVAYVDYDYYSFYDDRDDRRYDFDSEFADLDIRASEDGAFSLEKRFRARGRNPRIAEENAQEVTYNYSIEGSTITFDSDITFPRTAKFYFQEVDADLFIPVNQPFKIERNARGLIRYFRGSSSWWEISRNTWMFDENSQLICLTCEIEEVDDEKEAIPVGKSISKLLDNFNTIEISHEFDVELITNEGHLIELEGPASMLELVDWSDAGNQLDLSIKSGYSEDWSRVKVKIYAPNIERITLRQGAELSIENFKNDFVDFDIRDDSRLNLNADVNELNITMSAKARADLSGKASKSNITMREESRIYGYELEIAEVKIETESEARARLHVTEYINAEASGFSSIRYKGDPTLNVKDKSKSASISKY